MYQAETAPWLEFYAWNTDGSAKTDLVFNTAGISIVVVRDNLANSSALTLSAASGPTDWAAGKFWAMGGNKYRVGIATASISSFTGQISVEGSYTGGVLTGVTREVSAYNPAYEPLRPTTAGRTLDVSSGGEAGIDWANVGSPTTTVGLTGTTISSSQVAASVTGAVGSVTGAVGSVAGNVGGNVNGNVVGSVASVAGNVSGSVGSVSGAVGSVTGSVGSVVGNVGGSTASVAGAVGSVTGNVGGDVSGKVLGGGSGTISGDGVRAASVTGAVGSVTGSVGSVVGAVVLDSSATAALVDLIWDEPLTGATHNVATSSGKRLRQTTAFQQIDSTVIDASATTTTFATGLDSAVDNFYNDSMLVFTDGALAGQVRAISDYVGATKTIILEEALTSAPVNGVAFTIVSLHIHPVSQIQSGLATAASIVTLRGADSDTLKTLSDQIDTVSTNVSSIASVSREAF